MTKLIYLRADELYKHDPEIIHNTKVGNWVAPHMAISYAGAFTRSRSCDAIPNFDFLAPAISKMPGASDLGSLDSFEHVFDELIVRYCNEFAQHNKTIYISWSGGIDSTTIMTGFLRNAPKEILERIIILCNDDSIKENPYFYHTFLKDKFKQQIINTFLLDATTVNTSIVIDGEAGNQCMGNNIIAKLVFANQSDILLTPWRNVPNLNQLLAIENRWISKCPQRWPNIDTVVSNWVNRLLETVPYSPVEINTIYDLFWWANFDMKFNEVLLRKIPGYSYNLTNTDTKTLWDDVLLRPFASKELQCWSMLSKDLRAEMTTVDLKYFAKKYILDFDNNYHYFEYKTETGSFGISHLSNSSLVFAIDTDWNKYTLKRREDRQFLGKLILEDNL